MSQANDPDTIIIGLSGPSSSGKTTLARLLRQIFNVDASPDTNNVAIRLFILHEDDFYKTDADIPVRTVASPSHGTRQLQDWDCVESLDLGLLRSTLIHVKRHGRLPTDLFSKEDQNSVGDSGVADTIVHAHHTTIRSWLKTRPAASRTITICILDGFLLYPAPPNSPDARLESSGFPDTAALQRDLYGLMAETLDLKLFLPSSRALTVARRAARQGYVTLEGFWEDPPGYVDEIVWPNYARDHAWMFVGGGEVDRGRIDGGAGVIREEGVWVGPLSGEEGGSMKSVLDWGVERVREAVARVLR